MSRGKEPISFRANAARALQDSALRSAMAKATDLFVMLRSTGIRGLPFEDWRERGSAIKQEVIDNLPGYIDQFAANATAAGAVVHRAKDAESARETVGYILKDRRATKVVKAKSMVTEEIFLNEYLEAQGVTVFETDLGEFIVQLTKEHPSHILAPAIHMNRKQIGALFAEKLGSDYSEDPAVLTKIARRVLREQFLQAQAGITGANFAVAESGSLAIFTNEGNGRMVTTVPPLHIAVFSMEKVVPTIADLANFIRLLPRSATGQILSSYLSIITGTRKPNESTGAKELHIVILDNGRSDILAGEFREMLKCVRCGACMNVCPVYLTIGGHAYDSTYPGPMGIVLTTLLDGMERAHPLLDATTLCGACSEVCPVKIPLVKLIHRLRELRVAQGFTPASERSTMAAFGMAASSRPLFSLGQTVSRLLWPAAPYVTGNKAFERLPRPAGKTFKRRM